MKGASSTDFEIKLEAFDDVDDIARVEEEDESKVKKKKYITIAVAITVCVILLAVIIAVASGGGAMKCEAYFYEVDGECIQDTCKGPAVYLETNGQCEECEQGSHTKWVDGKADIKCIKPNESDCKEYEHLDVNGYCVTEKCSPL